MADVIAFVGPTLAGRRPHLQGISWRPPVKRGDVLTALVEKPHTLILIDGYYYQVAAVTHKEILYALDAGVRVIGAASMGALRAAELHAYGMEGVGRVFEWFRDGDLDGDDEVAVMHGPAEVGYVATSVALVVVRDALDGLVAGGHAETRDADRIISNLKALPFQERTEAVVEEHVVEALGPPAWPLLSTWMAKNNIKTRDAEVALLLSETRETERPPRSRRMGCYLAADLAHHVASPGAPVRLLDALQVAQVLHFDIPDFVRWVRRRSLTRSVAEALGIEPRPERVGAWRVDLAARECVAGHLMPEPELRAEAEILALSEAVRNVVGPPDAVAGQVARQLGLDPDTPEATLLDLVAATDLPVWELIRPFAFNRLLESALAVARAAREVHECFLTWSDGARAEERTLWPLAAELWQCDEDEVIGVASRRGLFRADARNSGLREALELVAAAERLPRPINDYRQARRRFLAERLDPPHLEAPEPIGRARSA